MNKSIIIGFSKPIGFKLHAWIIMKLDKAPFDHAYLKFNLDNINRELVYQSIDVGVQLVSQNQFATQSIPIEEYQLDVSYSQFISMFQFCIDNAGKMYSIWGVIGEGLVKIASKIGLNIKNPFNSNNKTYFCSELVAQCLDQIDPVQFNLNADNISPGDLNILLQKLNIKRIL